MKTHPLLIGSLLVFVGVVVTLFVLSSQSTLFSQNATISGRLDINGVPPDGSTLTLLQKELGSTSPPVAFAKGIAPTDDATWTFSDAKRGMSYEITAELLQGQTVIAHSSPLSISAPGQDGVITLNIQSDEHDSDQATGDAVLSGTIGVNGYIPAGSTITIQGRTLGKSDFANVATGLPGKDEQFMSYTTAVAGRTYEVRGILYDPNGAEIGTSSILTITAPATNEELHINSTAAAPATPTSQPGQPTPTPQAGSAVSGTITFNGQAPQNSRIVIFQRPSGQGDYQVAVDNVSPASGTGWQWTGAKAGTRYDMVAVLKQRQSNGTDKDLADANTLTLAAPAANEVFTINSGFTLPQASGTISVNCGTHNSNNTWNVTVSFQSISGAQSYWYQIGTTNGGADLTNNTANATNNTTQSFSETFQDGVTYFARYAYANVPNLAANSSQFSPFSSTTQLRCTQ